MGTTRVIIGTLPPPRFSTRKLKERDVDFCYGSQDSMLWPILEKIYSLQLLYDNSVEAVQQRKEFLTAERLGICDIVSSCIRQKIDASDLGMKKIKLRNILLEITRCPTLNTLLFMGGNSKNGPEYLFRQQLKTHNLAFQYVADKMPRVHYFKFQERQINTVSLISPSNAANRAIGSTELYKKRKQHSPSYTTFDYRIEQYRQVFITMNYLESISC